MEPIPAKTDLLSISLLPDRTVAVHVSLWIVGAAVIFAVLVVLWRLWNGGAGWKEYEIDQAEMGIGNAKFRLKPNLTDRQVAYAIWVELSTRKIGLPIDFDHDVIAEVYDSWFGFFTITRDLVKTIPVNKVKAPSTQAIIHMSIEVLNEGLRPHLTKWQARFRRWYEHQLEKKDGDQVIDPQDIQKKFPRYDDLRLDMMRVNDNLIRYRAKMRELVMANDRAHLGRS